MWCDEVILIYTLIYNLQPLFESNEFEMSTLTVVSNIWVNFVFSGSRQTLTQFISSEIKLNECSDIYDITWD